jgi:serine/threonine-protein kinase RsbW
LTVRHAAESAAEVRRALVADLVRAGLSRDFLDDAVLLATELVGNSVRYAHALSGDVLKVSWELTRWRLVLRVTDGGGRDAPHVEDAGPRDTRGRGLAIVDALAAEWGVDRGRDGRGGVSTVWAELPVPDGIDRAHRFGHGRIAGSPSLI